MVRSRYFSLGNFKALEAKGLLRNVLSAIIKPRFSSKGYTLATVGPEVDSSDRVLKIWLILLAHIPRHKLAAET